MWHLLKQESGRAGRPIVCVNCKRPHDKPGPFGRCAGCGHSYYGIESDAQLPLQLEATANDFHGGEQ